MITALETTEALASNAELGTMARPLEWRRFVYSGCIVNLYGAFEQFADGVVRYVAENARTFSPTFAELPKDIAQAHASQARELLGGNGRGRLADEDLDQLVLSLASCLSGPQYTLSGDALSFHSANLRLSELKSLLARVGVDLRESALPEEARRYFSDGSLEGTYADLESLLQDVVQRRNDISHGGYSELLAPEIILGIAEVLSIVVLWIFDSTRLSIYQGTSREVVGHITKYLEKVEAHLVRVDDGEVEVGTLTYGIERRSKRLRAARILSIRDADVDVDYVSGGAMRDPDRLAGLKFEPSVVFSGVLHVLPDAVGNELLDDNFIESLVTPDTVESAGDQAVAEAEAERVDGD